MAQDHIDHDRLFKELLETFFAAFMELFFPEASRAIDFGHVKFLQQEVFTDLTAGEKHEVDILVETRLKDEPGLILVHIEPQAYVQKEFAERMYIYFSRLYEKYRRRILPVAVFAYDQARDEPDTFSLGFSFLDVLRFRFYKLELKKLYWRDFIQSDNPVAAALLSKMGFLPEEKVRVRIEFLRMLTRMKLDPARMELIAAFFETYLKLSPQEEEEFDRQLGSVDQKEVEAIMQLTTSWHEKGRMEGRTEGVELGKLEETRTAILDFLESRFGECPAWVATSLEGLKELEQLKKLRREVFKADSLEEALAVLATDGSREN
ncbi:MAG: Rpn family recombination-promoting nuclease/putative transposase [Clostridia bacterium]|nr:Rpn family recombination-promoting nuclease/putative transposase [Clostridia bacterium]